MDSYKDSYIGIPYIRILWDFHGDSNGFYESSIRFLNIFLLGFYQEFYEDHKGIQGDSAGLL